MKMFEFHEYSGDQDGEDSPKSTLAKKLDEAYISAVAQTAYRMVSKKNLTKDKAIQQIKTKYSFKSVQEIEELFDYSLDACQNIVSLTKSPEIRSIELDFDHWIYGEEPLDPEQKIPVELEEFCRRYNRLPKDWLIHTIHFDYFWTYLK